jgi:dCMP deaminase
MAYSDLLFLKRAKEVSLSSKDPSTKTGAVIVRKNNTIVSEGFNKFPDKMVNKETLYNVREEKYSRIVHCETNALLMAKCDVSGCTLYTYPFASCDRCCVQMIQAGIVRFVYPELPDDKKYRWQASLELTKKYMKECGVQFEEIKGLI